MASNGAALVGLVSLLSGASVSAASLRGAGTWFALVLLGFLGRWLLEQSFPEYVETETPYEFDPQDLA